MATKIEQSSKVSERQVIGLMWVCLFGGGVGDVAGWWAGGHQSMTGEGHVLVVGLGDGTTAEVVGVFPTGAFESVNGEDKG